MNAPCLAFLTLRTANLEASRAFYEALGLTFAPETHGSGPLHYACDLNGVTLELFPGASGVAPDFKSGGATMLGVRVASLDAVLEALRVLGVEPKAPPQASNRGRRVLVFDPDGRAVDVSKDASA